VPWAQPLRIESAGLAFNAAPETDALLAAAQTNNFEVQMRRVELEQQGFRVSLAQKEKYPAFTVGPYFSQERAGDREQQVGIGVSVPLPLWNKTKGSVETAAARHRAARRGEGAHVSDQTRRDGEVAG
jgi:cobalt-zinc-cadmium efflux system outer membrane protein